MIASCPECSINVLVKSDGTCPSCGTVIDTDTNEERKEAVESAKKRAAERRKTSPLPEDREVPEEDVLRRVIPAVVMLPRLAAKRTTSPPELSAYSGRVGRSFAMGDSPLACVDYSGILRSKSFALFSRRGIHFVQGDPVGFLSWEDLGRAGISYALITGQLRIGSVSVDLKTDDLPGFQHILRSLSTWARRRGSYEGKYREPYWTFGQALSAGGDGVVRVGELLLASDGVYYLHHAEFKDETKRIGIGEAFGFLAAGVAGAWSLGGTLRTQARVKVQTAFLTSATTSIIEYGMEPELRLKRRPESQFFPRGAVNDIAVLRNQVTVKSEEGDSSWQVENADLEKARLSHWLGE